MLLPSWEDNGFPFEFMLRVNGDGLPEVRLLVWKDTYNDHASSLADWARRVSASAGPLIDEAFTPLSGWREWRHVLLEEDYPPEAILGDQRTIG